MHFIISIKQVKGALMMKCMEYGKHYDILLSTNKESEIYHAIDSAAADNDSFPESKYTSST
jgi:hypothetical protein